MFSWQFPVSEIPAIDLSRLEPEAQEAIAPYLERAQQAESDARARGQLGMILQAYELYSPAAECYRGARAIDPSNFRWPYLLAAVEERLGNFEAAIGALRQTLEIRPDFEPAKLRLAETMLAASQLDESFQLFNALAESQPNSPMAHYGRGRILSKKGRSQEAIQALERAVELFPKFGSAHYSLALAYRDIGDREAALHQMRLYQQYRNQWPPIKDELLAEVQQLKISTKDLISLGVNLAEKGRYEEAIEIHLKALAKDPDLSQIHANLLQLYARVGKLEKAIDHYRKAVEINPDFYESHYNYGVLMLQQGKRSEARKAFEEVIRINPYHADACNNLGSVLMSDGELQEAAQRFSQALQNDPRHQGARFNLGRVLVALGDVEEASRQFESLTQEKDDSELPRYLYALAATRIRMGDREKGLQLARQAHSEAVRRGQSELAERIAEDIRRLDNRQP